MPLKAFLDSLDGVPEALHEHYEPTPDGKYKLAAEGVEDVSGLKSALEKERQERKAAKEALKAFEGIDPARYKELTEKEQALKEKKLIDAGKLDEVIAERTGRMKAEYERQLKELTERSTRMAQQLDKLLIDNELSAAAIQAGVEETGLEDVLRRGREVYRVHDGKALPFKGDEIIYGKDGNPLTMGDWLGELAAVAPHLFKRSSGGGAEHKPGPGGAKALKRSTMTAQEKAKYISEHGSEKYLALPA